MSCTDWEARYQSGDMPWEKGAPSPGLVDFLAANRNLTGETVCVPGCGTGHDVREWAKADFSVYGYDLAPSAIRLGVERTQAAGLHADFQLGDFLRTRSFVRLIRLSANFMSRRFCAGSSRAASIWR
jgi:2-polyprenyl-3-methyl-5-hydroxy-6-metoxy-1,4-benzoquinol methylase